MKKLSERNHLLILQALKTCGNDKPEEAFAYIEESLYVNDAEVICMFLHWLNHYKRTVGHDNLRIVWSIFYDELLKPKKNIPEINYRPGYSRDVNNPGTDGLYVSLSDIETFKLDMEYIMLAITKETEDYDFDYIINDTFNFFDNGDNTILVVYRMFDGEYHSVTLDLELIVKKAVEDRDNRIAERIASYMRREVQ